MGIARAGKEYGPEDFERDGMGFFGHFGGAHGRGALVRHGVLTQLSKAIDFWGLRSVWELAVSVWELPVGSAVIHRLIVQSYQMEFITVCCTYIRTAVLAMMKISIRNI
jgi:hypothetical protein